MAKVLIAPSPVITTNAAGEAVIRNTFQWGEEQTWDIDFSFEGDRLELTAEPESWLVLALLPAMQSGLDIELSQPVSVRLLQNLASVQAIFNTWDASYQKIKIHATARSTSPKADSPKGKTACFFSGGIDSFYTILTRLAEIDVLIYMDNPWAGEAGRARMNGKISEAARRLGKQLIIVKSNFRDFLDTYTPWDLSHGAALVTMAHFLTPYISKVYLASARTYDELQPDGTHPLLDPLWSSEDLEVIHYGADTTKYNKTHYVAQNEVFLDCVRVCWENIENELNCGRCSKCLVTMVMLRVARVLDRCPAFAVPLDLDYLANYDFIFSRKTLKICLDAVEKSGDDPALAEALRQALRPRTQPDPELVELRQRLAYYDQGLRFQMVDKLFHLLSKNQAVFRRVEAVGRHLWKLVK